MRLLNVYNLSFAEFDGDDIPPYAIAPHRWAAEEATYVDVLEGKNKDTDGYKKIKSFCNFTIWRNQENRQQVSKSSATSRLEYIWIDTCCIDRRSSAELAENINSMFRYYERAEECYAYLSDVKNDARPLDLIKNFKRSDWFTRGWTLQELIAPSQVFFISADWKIFGHKCSGHADPFPRCGWGKWIMNRVISKTTGINLEVLRQPWDPERVNSLNQILEWMKNRTTTRKEDLAYCLIGLLGISMSIRYGEGQAVHAWQRLRRKLSKRTSSPSGSVALEHSAPQSAMQTRTGVNTELSGPMSEHTSVWCDQCHFKSANLNESQHLCVAQLRSVRDHEGCGQRCASSVTLRQHAVLHDKRFLCPEKGCFKAFAFPKDLDRHREAAHSTERPYRCPDVNCKCSRDGFVRRDHLERHVWSMHPGLTLKDGLQEIKPEGDDGGGVSEDESDSTSSRGPDGPPNCDSGSYEDLNNPKRPHDNNSPGNTNQSLIKSKLAAGASPFGLLPTLYPKSSDSRGRLSDKMGQKYLS